MVKYESTGEHHFLWFLEELNKHGFIKGVFWQEISFNLCDKVELEYKTTKLKRKANSRNSIIDLKEGFKYETKKKTILPAHVYTPEAVIVWDRSAEGIFYDDIEQQSVVYENRSFFIGQKLRTHIEQIDHEGFHVGDMINPVIISVVEVKPSFDFRNMTRLFKINKQFMWSVHKLYVNLCVTPDMFLETFLPERYLLTDKSMTKRNDKVTKSNYKLINDYVQKRREINNIK